MEIISETSDFCMNRPSAVAIGKFDGVHLGHRLLLNELVKQTDNGLRPTVFTFDPSPEVFFGFGKGELSTKEEKRELFSRIGIEVLIEFPFNKETAAIPAENFVLDILLGRMKAQFIAAGPDLSFGDRGKGNFELLRTLSSHKGCEVEMIDKLTMDGKTISSTLIRSLVQDGEMEEAAHYLGRNYSVRGMIRHGLANGRKIGFPTINQIPPAGKLMPPNGVYFTRTTIGGRQFRSITNIGDNPTIGDHNAVTVETFLFDYRGDLYGEEAVVELLHYHRPERKFSDLQALKAQIENDRQSAACFHEQAVGAGSF